ncbi:MgtE intracellular region [Coriobacterium glomerans PW2]|uniref:MgtE intracellular region n=1 Tax=Coriobacterium glomerans (strain ATCC 49209 / DSM 20642 / JCM 10262 / PW2) TaxID=700015 RepID=F2NAB8_CORGP|nr:CBS domain-containing protein [Coriobacterium glomerans]AEB06304.1 MgtE intracellular region [Coriobacterium glomerans PW2]
MKYFSEMIDLPVLDSHGENLGVLQDLGVAPAEVFPHVTSIVFHKVKEAAAVVCWEGCVDHVDAQGVHLAVTADEIRPAEREEAQVLLARDILNKQFVDTQAVKVARANDLKLSQSGPRQLRLLGAEIGVSGLLRALSPAVERIACRICSSVGKPLTERIVAWSYMDLLDRNIDEIRASVSHKTINELHPADIADIIEQVDPASGCAIFAQLDTAQAAETIAEIDDEDLLEELLKGVADGEISAMLAHMDPDDAAAFIGDLDQQRGDALLQLMDERDEHAIKRLLSYQENTAGRIMTSEFVALPGYAKVCDAFAAIRRLEEDFESIYYVYTVDEAGALTGVLSLRTLISAQESDRLQDLAFRDLVWVAPQLDQEDVADEMTKYNLVAVPVCDGDRRILGIVTVDDALDVIAEEHDEDLRIAGIGRGDNATGESTHMLVWFAQRQYWVLIWALASAAGAAALGALDADPALILYPMCAMPVALLASGGMVSFVKNYFLEHDDREGTQSAYGAFLLKTTVVGVVLAALVLACAYLVDDIALPDATQAERDLFLACFAAAAAVTLLSAVGAIGCLRLLRWRDEHDLNTSGTALGVISTLISAVLFTAISIAAVIAMA